MTRVLIILGKLIAFISKVFNKGNGSTWPGHIALSIDKSFIKKVQIKSDIKIVLVVGTNGKTTTGKIISSILEENGKTVLQNSSGANLLNGIASALLLNTNASGKVEADFAVFEIDENVLPLILQEVVPFAIIALNLFRDQLDRYGELDSITKKWKESLRHLSKETILILNADDPQIAFLGIEMPLPSDMRVKKVIYFGLEEKGITKLAHSADSIYCPRCSNKLSFTKIFYSHLGIWHCEKCGLKRPQPSLNSFFYPLSGTYNRYNTLAAVLFVQQLKIADTDILKALQTVKPAFGRQEKIELDGKSIQIFLAKNPTSFNQSLQTIAELHTRYTDTQQKSLQQQSKSSMNREPTKREPSILFVLNDRIPDGRDVSWIWDIDVEDYMGKFGKIFVSGDRVYDMALRLEYAKKYQKINEINLFEDLEQAISQALSSIDENEILYILPTYSAMLEVRKILTGKKIL